MILFRRIVFVCLILSMSASVALAQDKKAEISVSAGYTWGSDIPVNPNVHVTGQIFNRAGPKSGFTWGFQGDYNASENFAVGFLFSSQESKLFANQLGVGEIDIVDMRIRNYHGVFTYNFGDEDQTVRPYVFGGLGATSYSPDSISVGNLTADFDSRSKFSTTWGGGVKFFPSPNFGFKVQGRWTPTHIKSEPAGIWCGPVYCFVASDASYSHQGEFTGGVIFRF